MVPYVADPGLEGVFGHLVNSVNPVEKLPCFAALPPSVRKGCVPFRSSPLLFLEAQPPGDIDPDKKQSPERRSLCKRKAAKPTSSSKLLHSLQVLNPMEFPSPRVRLKSKRLMRRDEFRKIIGSVS